MSNIAITYRKAYGLLLKYFKGDVALTKQFLIKIVKSKVIYEKFLPDGIKYESLSKDFLFSVSIIK